MRRSLNLGVCIFDHSIIRHSRTWFWQQTKELQIEDVSFSSRRLKIVKMVNYFFSLDIQHFKWPLYASVCIIPLSDKITFRTTLHIGATKRILHTAFYQCQVIAVNNKILTKFSESKLYTCM